MVAGISSHAESSYGIHRNIDRCLAPQDRGEKQLVRSQLERVVSDGRFAASKRYPCLLRYVVENALAGTEDNLKERTLGIEDFTGHRITTRISIRSCVCVRRRCGSDSPSTTNRQHMKVN